MWKAIIVSIIFLMQFSCVDNNSAIVNQECEPIDSLCNDSTHVMYCKFFYPSGILKREGIIINDSILYGWHKYYSHKGVLESEEEYIWSQDGKNLLNRVLRFDEKGDTLKNRSNYFTIELDKKAYQLGDTANVTLNLVYPLFKSDSAIIILPTDTDSGQLQKRLIMSNGKRTFQYVISNSSTTAIQGVIREFHYEGNIEKRRDLDFYVWLNLSK